MVEGLYVCSGYNIFRKFIEKFSNTKTCRSLKLKESSLLVHVERRSLKLCLVVNNVVKFSFFQFLIFSLLLLTYNLYSETCINQMYMAHLLVSALNRF